MGEGTRQGRKWDGETLPLGTGCVTLRDSFVTQPRRAPPEHFLTRYSKSGIAIIEFSSQSATGDAGWKMRMPDISSDWKPSYVMAMRELNRTRLKFLLTDAERAMFTRYEELADSPDHHHERVQMSNALEDLQAVRLNLLT